MDEEYLEMSAKRQNKKQVVENVVEDEDPFMEDNLLDEEAEAELAEAEEELAEEELEEADDEKEEEEDDEDFGIEKDEDDVEEDIIEGEEFDEEDDDEEDDDEEKEFDEDDEESSIHGGASTKEQTKTKRIPKIVKNIEPTEEIQYGIDSDDDEVEFEKFEEDTRDQYLLNFHPEAMAVNFEEVKSLCTIVRDEDGDIIDPFHTTIPIMTKYEKARILGLRAKQLNSNIRPMVPIPDYMIDSYRIAEFELAKKAIPFIIRRPLPDGRSEYWRINDLTCVY